MHMEKLGGSDWLKTIAFSCNTYAKLQHECKVVTLVHALKILLSRLSVKFFHVHH